VDGEQDWGRGTVAFAGWREAGAVYTPLLIVSREEAQCVALRNMSIGDVCPKEFEEPPEAQDQPSSSIQASPPTQDEEIAQEEENEDQDDEPP
jgi:hypothetical protein